MNPRVTFGSCFVDDYPVGTDSVFVHFFKANRAANADESTHHLWKQFR
jgi:hypothetical protein